MRSVRPLCEADVDAVVRLEEASFHTPWTRADFEGELKNPLALYLVVLEDDELIAYGGSWIVFDECHITNIAVAPSMRGAGVGTYLMRELLGAAASARGARSYTLEVRPSNDAAIALYQKFDFIVEGRRKRYYADTGEDALIMWRHGEGDRSI